jgi:hypothetical protein
VILRFSSKHEFTEIAHNVKQIINK